MSFVVLATSVALCCMKNGKENAPILLLRQGRSATVDKVDFMGLFLGGSNERLSCDTAATHAQLLKGVDHGLHRQSARAL